MQLDESLIVGRVHGATIVVLTIAAAFVQGAASGAGVQAASAADPIKTDVNITGHFLQNRTKDPHDPKADDRCGEPQISQDALHPDTLVMSCMSMAGLTYQSPAPGPYLTWIYTDTSKTSNVDQPCHTFISHDAGNSWNMVQPPLKSELIVACADPLAQRGPHGELYLGGDGIHYPVDGKDAPVITRADWPVPREPLGIVFSRSLDDGKTWSKPIVLPTANDRPHWTVDQSTGVIYDVSGCATFDPKTRMGSYGCTPSSRNLAVSTDQGRTWTPTVDVFNKEAPTKSLTPGRLHDISFDGGGGAIAAAGGVFATAGISGGGARAEGGAGEEESAGGGTTVMFKYSADNGQTFKQNRIPLGGSADCAAPSVEGLAGDPVHRGAFAAIVVCGPSARAARVFLTRDLGATWKETAKLAVVPPPDYRGNPGGFGINRLAASFGPTGALGVMWRQNYGSAKFPPMGYVQPGPQDVFVAISADGGATFADPIRVNTAASPPADPRTFFGDDISDLVIDTHYAYVVWGDWRSGELQTWFRKVSIPSR